MPNLINQLLLKTYQDRFRNSGSFVSVGYEGMDVKTATAFRARVAAQNMRMTFVRNRLLQIAFRELGRPEVKSICVGQTALVEGEDPVAVARFLADFQKEHKELKIHGALVDNAVLDARGALELSKCPSHAELRSMIVGQVLSPGARAIGALLAPARNFAGAVKSQVEKLEKQGQGADGGAAA